MFKQVFHNIIFKKQMMEDPAHPVFYFLKLKISTQQAINYFNL